MKKILGAFLTVCMAITALVCGTSVYAEKNQTGQNGLYFYDFEGYSAEMGSRKGPDDNWIGVVDYYSRNYGSVDIGEGHGTAMRIRGSGEPSFLFPKIVTSGKLHIGFDAKFTSNNLMGYIIFYDGQTPEPSRDKYGRALTINTSGDGSLNCYPTPTGWGSRNIANDFDATQWHHYDFVTSDLSGNIPMLSCYIDGELKYSDVNLSSAQGIRTWTFLIEPQKGKTPTQDDGFIVDNMYIKQYTGSDDFSAEIRGNERFSVTDGRISMAMTERIISDFSKENLIITNISTGDKITDFSIENFTGQTFDIAIHGTVDYGRYEISFKDVIGEISKEAISKNVVAETEFKTVTVNKTTELDFNDYSETDGSLPAGFECLEEGVEQFAKSVIGKTGNVDDFALGFEEMPTDRIRRRLMYQFDAPVSGNIGTEVSFDMYVQNATQYIYLADKGDFDKNNPDNKNNAVLSVNSKGYISYANTRTENPSKPLDSGFVLTPGKWHNIKIRFEYEETSGIEYMTLVFDDDKEYRLESERMFCKNGIYGIGIGYLRTSASAASVKIDNIYAKGEMIIYYPQAGSIKVYNSFGEEENITGASSAMISEIKTEFNTLISHDIDEYISVTEDGSQIPISYEVLDDSISQKSVLVIKFDELLNRLRDYKITIKKGIPSAFSDEITSFLDSSIEIKSNNDASFKIKNFGYDNKTNTAKVIFSKNNDSQGMYIYAVAGYKNVKQYTDEGEVDAIMMTSVRYIPIEIKASDRGKLEYNLKLDDNSADEYKTFLWRYPKIERINCSDDGTIN